MFSASKLLNIKNYKEMLYINKIKCLRIPHRIVKGNLLAATALLRFAL